MSHINEMARKEIESIQIRADLINYKRMRTTVDIKNNIYPSGLFLLATFP